jgi:hypothetical protein
MAKLLADNVNFVIIDSKKLKVGTRRQYEKGHLCFKEAVFRISR